MCATKTTADATMDRTMYGKIEPGTLHPFRCAKKGLDSPGCEFFTPLLPRKPVFEGVGGGIVI
jgi:hypothetical protein